MRYVLEQKKSIYTIGLFAGIIFGFSSGIFFMGLVRSTIAFFESRVLVYDSQEIDKAVVYNAGGGYSTTGNEAPPAISAEAFKIVDLESGFVFLERASTEKYPIASLTKLMTAAVSQELFEVPRKVTISKEDVEIAGDTGMLLDGEVYMSDELLMPLLISSSNDAAFALARQVGVGNFIDVMNQKARALGLLHTSFQDPSGLHRGNVSSAGDLIELVSYLYNEKRDLLSLTRLTDTGRSSHIWPNYNWKGDQHMFLGGKSGMTDAAEKTFVGIFMLELGAGPRPISVAILQSANQVDDTTKLIEWVRRNFTYGNQVAAQAAPDQKTIRMLFVGDIMMDRGIESIAQKQSNGDFQYFFDHARNLISGADVAFGNLEGPIADSGVNVGSQYSFRMDPSVATALNAAGFDIVSLANNHIGDYGQEALLDTIEYLKKANIAYTGAGFNRMEATAPTVMSVGSTDIGFLAFSDEGPRWMEASDAGAGLVVANEAEIANTVRQAREKVDILIVSFHFGEEYKTKSNERQQRLARLAVDAGAALVVGHHPHVVQEIETYHSGTIAYSLGNFIFDQAFSLETKEGLALEVDIQGGTVISVEPIRVTFNEHFQPIISQDTL